MSEMGNKVVKRSERTFRGMKRVGLLVLGLAGYCGLILAIAGYAAWGIEAGNVSAVNAIIGVVFGMSLVNLMVNIAGL